MWLAEESTYDDVVGEHSASISAATTASTDYAADEEVVADEESDEGTVVCRFVPIVSRRVR